MKDFHKVDVVLPVFNAADHISQTLEALKGMSDLFDRVGAEIG